MPQNSRDHSLNLAPASVGDYRELARRRLPRQIFDYVDGGAFGETTLNANRDDLHHIQFRQRVLRDVSERRLATTVLGEEIAMPLILAPVGFGGMLARRAEVQAAKAAERAGIPFCESTLSICGIEEVAAAVKRPVWFQLYVMKDRRYAEDLMVRAQAVGCTTLDLDGRPRGRWPALPRRAKRHQRANPAHEADSTRLRPVQSHVMAA